MFKLLLKLLPGLAARLLRLALKELVRRGESAEFHALGRNLGAAVAELVPGDDAERVAANFLEGLANGLTEQLETDLVLRAAGWEVTPPADPR